MTDLDMYYAIRTIAAAEAIVVIVLVFVQVHLTGGWKRCDAINRFRLSGIALLAAAWGYGAIEAMIDGTPGNLRALFGAIALGYLGLAYAATVRELCKKPIDG